MNRWFVENAGMEKIMGLVGDWVVSREEFRVLVSACVHRLVYPPKTPIPDM